MSLPHEPRQKMINIMYLVLTALLALNVSAEILNAFKTIDKSLQNSNRAVSTSTEDIMASLQKKTTEPDTKEQALLWYPKAQQVREISKQTYGFVDDLRRQILETAGNKNVSDPNSRYKEDNLEIITKIMIDEKKALELKKILDEYKNKVLSVDPSIKEEFANYQAIETTDPVTVLDGSKKPWDEAFFYMVPVVAGVTILSKFSNDVKTFENKVITAIHNKVGHVEIVYNQFAAIVGQSSSYLIPGQELEITAGVGAFNNQARPQIMIGGSSYTPNETGVASARIPCGSVGSHSIPVSISFRDPNGKMLSFSKTVEYTVGQTSAAVALDKMNVLFIGVPNPISLSASGDLNKVSASISQGNLTRGDRPGQYFANVTTDGDCTINVNSDGKSTPFKFRVRSIPDPTPMVGRNKGGSMNANEFKSQAGVRAVLENFFYETQFVVTSYRMTFDGEGFDGLFEVNNTGAAWSPQAQNNIRKCRPGTFVTIEDIRCKGPDGRTRSLPPLLYNLN